MRPIVELPEKISLDERWKIKRRAEFAILKLRRGRAEHADSVKYNEIKPPSLALKYWQSLKSKAQIIVK